MVLKCAFGLPYEHDVIDDVDAVEIAIAVDVESGGMDDEPAKHLHDLAKVHLIYSKKTLEVMLT